VISASAWENVSALGGTRIPTPLIRRFCVGIRTRSEQSVTSGHSLPVVQGVRRIARSFVRMAPRAVRSRLRRRRTKFFEFCILPARTRSVVSLAAESIPRIFRIMEASAVITRTLQGMARVRSGSDREYPVLTADRRQRAPRLWCRMTAGDP
jgi:hypothetical protein